MSAGPRVSIPAGFSLADTLDCGQAFRWRQAEGDPARWEGVAFGRALALREAGGRLELDCAPGDLQAVWRDYFDLDTDHRAIREELSALHPALARAIAFAPGLRVLRQEPWEALCSFVLSQNNNIRRIKGLVEGFCQLFGEEIAGTGRRAFPRAERVAALAPVDLEPLRCGYRAPYVLDAARKTAEGRLDFERIRREPAAYGREQLRTVHGVGPKVAECALLYGFHKTECFPMDVWMKRAMAVLLPGISPAALGPRAGIAQQYLFHYARLHPWEVA